MNAEAAKDLLALIAGARAELEESARSTASGMESMMRTFKKLAGQSATMLKQAAGIVDRVDNESMRTIAAEVQTFCASVEGCLRLRLETVTRVLETLKTLRQFLQQVAWLTSQQEAIARQFRALSVLTKVEVAQLGKVGADFRHLADELAIFADNICRETQELSRQTESRRVVIEGTSHALAADLPSYRNTRLHSNTMSITLCNRSARSWPKSPSYRDNSAPALNRLPGRLTL